VLVGTTSVEKSEMLSQLLQRKVRASSTKFLTPSITNAKPRSLPRRAAARQRDTAKTVGNRDPSRRTWPGRGTDIKLTPKVTESGGLHVTALSATPRGASTTSSAVCGGPAGRSGVVAILRLAARRT